MEIHSETLWHTSPTMPAMHAGFPQRVRCLMWSFFDANHIPDAASTMFRTVTVSSSLLFRSISFQKFTSIVIEHFCARWPPVVKLAVVSADCTHRMRNVSGPRSLHRSPSLLEGVFQFVALMGVPSVGEFSRCLSCSAQGQLSHSVPPRFVRTPNGFISLRLLTLTITPCNRCCSLMRCMKPRMSKRVHCSYRRRWSSSRCNCRIVSLFDVAVSTWSKSPSGLLLILSGLHLCFRCR